MVFWLLFSNKSIQNILILSAMVAPFASAGVRPVVNRLNQDTTVYYGLIFWLFSWPYMVKWHNSGIIKSSIYRWKPHYWLHLKSAFTMTKIKNNRALFNIDRYWTHPKRKPRIPTVTQSDFKSFLFFVIYEAQITEYSFIFHPLNMNIRVGWIYYGMWIPEL